MKIAIFTDSFFPGVGGTEKAVFGLAREYIKQGHKVLVCAPKWKNYVDDFDFEVARAKSISVTKFDKLGFPNISKKFKKQVESFCPDIIHCQSVSSMAQYGIKYAQKHSIPVVITVHTKFKTAFYNSIKSKFIVNIMLKNIAKKLNKCTKVYTVSNDMIDELQSYGYKGDISVIRNGFMLKKVEDHKANKKLAEEKYNLQNVENKFLFVGRINRVKNIDFTLDALKIVKNNLDKENRTFKMIFTGYGPDYNYYKNQASIKGLGDNVIFTGNITDEKLLSSIYSVADLFLFPSIFDNDPLVVVEAALNRTSSITLKGTGSSERIIDGESGFIINNNVQEMADKILYLVNNRDVLERVNTNAERLIPKAWAETAKEYLHEYESLINKT